jgi:hypothetical protein
VQSAPVKVAMTRVRQLANLQWQTGYWLSTLVSLVTTTGHCVSIGYAVQSNKVTYGGKEQGGGEGSQTGEIKLDRGDGEGQNVRRSIARL